MKKILYAVLIIAISFLGWWLLDKPPVNGDWQTQFNNPSRAEFNGDTVLVKNVRNFRYSPDEAEMYPNYYDKTYDLDQIKKVWYISEPFNEMEIAAHTFLSFEFDNGDFLSISIEAKKTKRQTYSVWKGMAHAYPLTYIAVDERDAILLRANLRKDKVYVYPVKLNKPENAKLILKDMLERMNELHEKPVWYNTIWRNCTSEIAHHVNRIDPGRIPLLSKELFLTSGADELALELGLLDTDLSITEAREKYKINEKSERAGDVEDYSRLIRD